MIGKKGGGGVEGTATSSLTAQKQHLSLGNIIVPRLVLLKRTSRKRNVIFSQEKSETFEVLTS